jgi:hypothetical protein
LDGRCRNDNKKDDTLKLMQKGFAGIFMLLLGFVIGVALVSSLYLGYQAKQKDKPNINSYEDCVKAGNPALLSYPGQCNTKDGRHFMQQLSPEEQQKLKLSTTPTAGNNEITNWKIYSNSSFNISLKYDPYFNPVTTFHPLQSGEPIFIVTDKFNFDRTHISICKTYKESVCIIPGKNWHQDNDIQLTKLAGKNAVSFFIGALNKSGMSQNVLHVIQTTDKPLIEIALTVDGQGGEEIFQQILATLKFN